MVSDDLDQYDEHQRALLSQIAKPLFSGDVQGYHASTRAGGEVVRNIKTHKEVDAGTHKDKHYMKEEEVNTAYKHALDADTPTIETCFEQVKTLHSVTDEYLEEARCNPVYAHIVGRVVDSNVSHPQVRSMRENKILSLKLHKKASTPNQLISDITAKRSVNDRLKALEQEVDSLKLKVDSVSISQESTDLNIGKILETIELPKDHDRTKAIVLRQKGYKVKNIANVLNVSESTVKRWTQGVILKNDP